jgi:hypothetical protein
MTVWNPSLCAIELASTITQDSFAVCMLMEIVSFYRAKYLPEAPSFESRLSAPVVLVGACVVYWHVP